MFTSALLLLLAQVSWAANPGQPVYVTNLPSLSQPVPVTVVNQSTGSTVGTYEAVNVSVVVSGGEGYAVFTATGAVNLFSIVPPSDSAVFSVDVESSDSDGFPMVGARNMRGKTGLHAIRFLLGRYQAHVYSASQDGTYKLRCIVQK
jgi:hypothetical protein